MFFVSFPVALPHFLMVPSASPSYRAAAETVPAAHSETPPASEPTVTVIVLMTYVRLCVQEVQVVYYTLLRKNSQPIG